MSMSDDPSMYWQAQMVRRFNRLRRRFPRGSWLWLEVVAWQCINLESDPLAIRREGHAVHEAHWRRYERMHGGIPF